MCRVLCVSRSGYYDWRGRPKSKRTLEDGVLKTKVKQIFDEHKGRYGVPRIHNELKGQGIYCGKKRIERIMNELELKAYGKRKFRVTTTDSNHNYPVFPNLLDRYFEVSQPNQIWTGDITYIRTQEGWLFLAVVIDLFSRKVVGWAMGPRITSQLAVNALLMAIKNRRPPPWLIFHSDRGVQYAAHFFRAIAKRYDIEQGMSRYRDPWNNAPTESFFATLKKELIRDSVYSTRKEAFSDIFRYIEGYYNRKRRHSFLDYLTPVNFERRMAT